MSNQLCLLTINDLLDKHFFIPHYQRGYRWIPQQVTQLLDDIWEYAKTNEGSPEKSFYCLQPIVVKAKAWPDHDEDINGFEVIDGQQRLTSLYIILQYLTKEFLKNNSLREDFHKVLFSIDFETRKGSKEFLENPQEGFMEYVDYYHINNAWDTVREWFEDTEKQMNRRDKDLFLNTLLGTRKDLSSVQVIWYQVGRGTNEVDDQKESVKLFNRLNLGKIRLTNAELVKALLLADYQFGQEDKEEASRRKTIIAQIWDTIEQALADENFWTFATNQDGTTYPTRIELILDLMSGKESGERDYYFTFLHFLEISKQSEDLWLTWQKIEQYYGLLKEWFADRNKFHRVGYLIATGFNLKDLLDYGLQQTKKTVKMHISQEIARTIDFDFNELDYTRVSDHQKIRRVLLLLNVETTRLLENDMSFFPFQLYKSSKSWSIEHIQAQNAENFNPNKKEPWLEWIDLHLKQLQTLEQNLPTNREAIEKTMAKLKKVDQDTISFDQFEKLFAEVLQFFHPTNEGSDQADHDNLLNNLTLLPGTANSALGSSVFSVKKNKLVQMDKQGLYIPICTRRLFLKYYANSPYETIEASFWTANDRQTYYLHILRQLRTYLNADNKSTLTKLSQKIGH